MTEPLADKIGVVNLGPVQNQTNYVTIHQGQQVALIYSDPVPDLRSFQGRGAEQSDLNKWLADSPVSLIGIRGEGGIGKSSLMAKVFAESLGFAGKFWADVRTVTSITALAERALQELGVLPDQVKALEEKDLIPRLLRRLQQGRYLLGIDNLESVLTTTGDWQSDYETFLEGFQDLGSESVLLLASREYPPKYYAWLRSRWLKVEKGLEPTEGAALLNSLEAEGTEEERTKVSEQVEGNPLALSLLAGWLREEFRPGERSVLQLQSLPDLFGVEVKYRGKKQVSLQRVFDWSFNRLSPEAQYLLSQASVLRGNFNREAASTLVQRAVKDVELEDLERRSLLQLLPGVDQHELRQYRLQLRVKDFAQKKAGDLTTAHERAIHYYWEHRTLQFQPNDNKEAANEYLETYFHEFTLGRYQVAAQTVSSCEEFLSRRGYFQLLVSLYQPLHDVWQPTSDQH